MENYFNYFTEIEEHYQRRRGTALLLSTLDWALIESWKDSGIPIEAALRGIDSAFDSYDRKPVRAKTRKVNSLAYCAQEVMAAAEQMKEAAVGTTPNEAAAAGLDVSEISRYVNRNLASLKAAQLLPAMQSVVRDCAQSLAAIAGELEGTATSDKPNLKLEDLERRLTVMEERLFAGLHAATPESELLRVREEADRDIAPYRRNLSSAQVDQLHRQYINKRLLERAKLPRLSLFYM